MSLCYQIIPVTHYQQNCSLVWCDSTKKGCFIDPGGDMAHLLSAAEAKGVTVEKVLLTHGHVDHVGAAGLISNFIDAPIYGPHMDDQFWLEAIPRQCEMFGFEHIDSFMPSKWLSDGDEVHVGDEVLSVIHTPGHTPGHIVFYHKGTSLAFVGDVIFQGSVGRSDLPQGDHETLIKSIHTRLLPLGDDVSFIPGHGPMSTFGRERVENPYLNG